MAPASLHMAHPLHPTSYTRKGLSAVLQHPYFYISEKKGKEEKQKEEKK